MGFKISLPKVKAPKIKVGDILKPVSSVAKSLANVQKDVVGSQLDAIGELMQKPAAAPLLTAAGEAFGGPVGGLLASSLAGNMANGAPAEPRPTSAQQIVQYQPAKKDNTNLFIGIGAGVFALVLILIFSLKRK